MSFVERSCSCCAVGPSFFPYSFLPRRKIDGHDAAVKTALFEKSDEFVAFSAANDNTIKRWDLRSMKPTHTYDAPDLNGLEYSKASITHLT